MWFEILKIIILSICGFILTSHIQSKPADKSENFLCNNDMKQGQGLISKFDMYLSDKTVYFLLEDQKRLTHFFEWENGCKAVNSIIDDNYMIEILDNQSVKVISHVFQQQEKLRGRGGLSISAPKGRYALKLLVGNSEIYMKKIEADFYIRGTG